MKTNIYILILALAGTAVKATAQIITPTVLPTQGGTLQGGGNIINYSFGQAFNGVLQGGANVITVGFLQPEVGKPTTPVAQTVCSNTAYTFTFYDTAGTGANQIEWALNSSFDSATIISSPGSFTVTVDTNSTDTIFIRSLAGTAGIVSSAVFTTATVHKSPTAYAGKNDTVDINTSAMLGDTLLSIGGAPPYTFNWSPANGLSDTTIRNPIATPITTTNYILVVTDSNGCTGRDTVNVYYDGKASEFTEITYNAENMAVTDSGGQIYVDFDVFASDTPAGLLFSQGVIFIQYDTLIFGKSIVDSGKVVASKGLAIDSPYYNLALADSTPSMLKISITHTPSPAALSNLGDVYQQLCHLRVNISAFNLTGVTAAYDSIAMAGLSKYQRTLSGIEFPYDIVRVSGLTESDAGLTYQIDPNTINLTETTVTFHIQAQADNSDGLIAPFQDGAIAITYSNPAFDQRLASGGEVSVSLTGDAATTDGGGNAMYFASVADSGTNEFIITIAPTTYYDESLAPQITTGPGFDDIVAVTMHITTCSSNGGIGFNTGDMQDGNDYFDVSGVQGDIDYTPVEANSVTSTLTGALCQPCTGHTITGIATSLSATPGTSVTIPSGTQDELFIIYGCGFGTSPGTVFFQNADYDAVSNPANIYSFTNPSDIQLWSDNKINLYVPSAIGDATLTNNGAGTGPFYVQTSDNTNIYSPDTFMLTIPFAVQNFRWTDGVPAVQYLVQQSEMFNTGCFGCSASGSCYAAPGTDPCHTNGYLFNFQDPNDSTSTAPFSSADFTDVQNSISWAMEEWTCNTGVTFTLATFFGNPGINQSDHDNMILSMSQDGDALVLPYGSSACTHSTPSIPCAINTVIANTTYTHSYYTSSIVDIDMVFDNSTPTNPPAVGLPTNFDYVLNDLTIDGSHKLFSRDAMHEFGHASQLGHVLPVGNEIMYYEFPYGLGDMIYAPNSNDIEGGEYVLDPIGKIQGSVACRTDANHAPNNARCSTLGINNPEQNMLISEYPNPFGQSFIINLNLYENTPVTIDICTILGQSIYNKDLGNLYSGSYSSTIQLPPGTANGLYLLKVKINNDEKIFKIIKE